MQKLRDSNMELLRVVAMLLVMIVHTIFISCSIPTTIEANNNPFSALIYFEIGAVSIICVNLFVLLTGWYGLNITSEKIRSLIEQVLFFSISIYAILVILFPSKYLSWTYASTIFLLNSSDYWFIKAYLGLALLSPIINSFLKQTTKKALEKILISFYLFQTIYGWASIYGADWFEGGYSAASFIGLYLLAHYIRHYRPKILEWTTATYFICFLTLSLLIAIVAFAVTYIGLPIAGRLFTYTNPLVILEAVFLLLFFNKIKIRSNKIINWFASSCLAAYLLHSNELILREYYGKIIRHWFLTENHINSILYTTIFIIVIFITAILIDKIRIFITKVIRTRC